MQTVQYVNQTLCDAIQARASDIHFECTHQSFRIRFRVDGALKTQDTHPIHLSSSIISRIKVLCHLDTTERRLPQDGRFNFYYKTGVIDCRVSICPSYFGEKIVIRLLENSKLSWQLEDLGFDKKDKRIFLSHLNHTSGLIILSGPTGSGKSLTLYHALNYLNASEKNICSVEDPVEIAVEGINQININPKIGLSFAHALRALLRQDPDILFIGEIRDSETAQIALSAALTGHLVLSTVHAKDAVSSVSRLKQLGLNSSDLAEALILLMSQRLVNRCCLHCKRLLHPQLANPCLYCKTGYHERIAIYELLSVSPQIKKMIGKDFSSEEIKCEAIKSGMKPLYQAGLMKINEGLTTHEALAPLAL